MARTTLSPPRLDKPVYQMNEAARLLQLPDKTLRRWIDGDRRFDKVIEPLIRPETTGSAEVTWGEFVEAGLLREYRVRRLPIERLRPLIAGMRDRLETLYPLAHAKPLFSDGWQLLWREQLESDTPESMYLVVEGGHEDGYQLMLGDIASQFVSRVEFEPPEQGVVARWFPFIETTRRIVLDPQVSFGLPTINGVKTEALAELVAAGERPNRVAKVYADFGIAPSDVWLATEFESRLARAA